MPCGYPLILSLCRLPTPITLVVMVLLLLLVVVVEEEEEEGRRGKTEEGGSERNNSGRTGTAIDQGRAVLRPRGYRIIRLSSFQASLNGMGKIISGSQTRKAANNKKKETNLQLRNGQITSFTAVTSEKAFNRNTGRRKKKKRHPNLHLLDPLAHLFFNPDGRDERKSRSRQPRKLTEAVSAASALGE